MHGLHGWEKATEYIYTRKVTWDVHFEVASVAYAILRTSYPKEEVDYWTGYVWGFYPSEISPRTPHFSHPHMLNNGKDKERIAFDIVRCSSAFELMQKLTCQMDALESTLRLGGTRERA